MPEVCYFGKSARLAVTFARQRANSLARWHVVGGGSCITSRMPNVIRSRDVEFCGSQFPRCSNHRRIRGNARELSTCLTARGRGAQFRLALGMSITPAYARHACANSLHNAARSLETTDCKAIFIIPVPLPRRSTGIAVVHVCAATANRCLSFCSAARRL